MRISEVIAELEKVKSEYGDLQVVEIYKDKEYSMETNIISWSLPYVDDRLESIEDCLAYVGRNGEIDKSLKNESTLFIISRNDL